MKEYSLQHMLLFDLFHDLWKYIGNTDSHIAQSVEAVECTDCTSANGVTPPNECPGYDTKQSDGEVPVILEL